MRVLGLVFTEGVSLETWVQKGLLSREKQIYEEHLKQGHFDKVIWFTYGINDLSVRNDLVREGVLDGRVQVVPMPSYFRGGCMVRLYSYMLPFIQDKHCKELCAIKTNQMGGAWTADIIHRRYGIPLILRTGYTASALFKNKVKNIKEKYEKWKMQLKCNTYRRIERKLYHRCDIALVSSMHDKQYVCESYNIPENRVRLLTNYIDCKLFHPMANIHRMDRFVFVGRVSSEKNLFNLIEAIGESQKGLDIYGDGELRSELEQMVKEKGYDVCFKGAVDNQKLASIYNQYSYYILTSPFEGMPKALLEAMACGLVCIGTDTDGINEVIKDEYTGYLIQDTSVDSIQDTINRIDEKKYQEISDCAAAYIQREHSLEKIVADEWEVFRTVI